LADIGGYLTDTYNWRWVFLINIQLVLRGFFVSVLVEDPPG